MGFFDRFKGGGANSDDEIKRYAQRTQALLLVRNRDWQQFLTRKLAETEAKITTVSKMAPAGLLDEDDDFDEIPDDGKAPPETAPPAPGGAPDLGDDNDLKLAVSLWQAQGKPAVNLTDDKPQPLQDDGETERQSVNPTTDKPQPLQDDGNAERQTVNPTTDKPQPVQNDGDAERQTQPQPAPTQTPPSEQPDKPAAWQATFGVEQ